MRHPILAMTGLAITLSGGISADPPVRGNARDIAVTIQTFQFTPRTVEIRIGTRVTWANGDGIEHTVTAGVPDSAQGSFGGTLATKGSTFSVTFDRTGTIPITATGTHSCVERSA